MFDDNNDVPLVGRPVVYPGSTITEGALFTPPHTHNHEPGEYCIFCPCNKCGTFFGRFGGGRIVIDVEPDRPKYADEAFVQSRRNAAAKREQDRLARQKAQGDKAAKDQPKEKDLDQSMKRRRH